MVGIGFDGEGFRKKIVRWAGDTMRKPGMVKNGCDQSGHGTLKLTVKSQK